MQLFKGLGGVLASSGWSVLNTNGFGHAGEYSLLDLIRRYFLMSRSRHRSGRPHKTTGHRIGHFQRDVTIIHRILRLPQELHGAVSVIAQGLTIFC